MTLLLQHTAERKKDGGETDRLKKLKRQAKLTAMCRPYLGPNSHIVYNWYTNRLFDATKGINVISEIIVWSLCYKQAFCFFKRYILKQSQIESEDWDLLKYTLGGGVAN